VLLGLCRLPVPGSSFGGCLVLCSRGFSHLRTGVGGGGWWGGAVWLGWVCRDGVGGACFGVGLYFNTISSKLVFFLLKMCCVIFKLPTDVFFS